MTDDEAEAYRKAFSARKIEAERKGVKIGHCRWIDGRLDVMMIEPKETDDDAPLMEVLSPRGVTVRETIFVGGDGRKAESLATTGGVRARASRKAFQVELSLEI